MKGEIPVGSTAVAIGTAPDNFIRPKRTEWLAVLVFLAVMFVVNVSSYNLYPTVWADEILWSDPAINLVNTGHFTTSVWGLQPAGAFWAAQSPLYCFVLSAWLPLVGQKLVAIRSLNYLLISIGAFLVWYGSWRYRLLARPLHRLVIPPLMLLGFGITFCYRSARPDILGMLCLICFGLAFLANNRRLRDVLLLLCAIAAPWIGVQIGLFVCVASFLAMLVFRQVTLRDLMVVGTGVCIGVVSMLLFFQAHGVLGAFMASVSEAAHEETSLANAAGYLQSVPRRFKGALGFYAGDLSSVPLLASLLCFWLWSPRNSNNETTPVTKFLLLLMLIIPFIFSFAAHFAFYYSYMTYVPLLLAFLIVCARASALANRKQRVLVNAVFGAAVLVAVVFGLPLRLYVSKTLCHIVPRSEYAGIICAQLKPDDVVFSDYPNFFEAKPFAQRVYSPMYSRTFCDLAMSAHDFSEDEKRCVTVLITSLANAEKVKGYFGGTWIAATEPFGDSCALDKVEEIPIVGRKLKHHLESPQAARYPLQIWRRLPD